MSSLQQEILQELEKNGWKLLTEKYKNLDSELELECNKGHKVYNTWKNLRKQLICPICQQELNYQESFKVKFKPKDVYRTLSIDQATHVCGWAVLDNKDLIAYGVFQVPEGTEEERIHSIHIWLISMIKMWNPDQIGLEGIQLQDQEHRMGVTVFQTLARLQGVLIETCMELEVKFQICPTNVWRNFCGVKGKTRVDKKRSMQFIISQKYGVNATDDIADAIGIGIYFSNKTNAQIEIKSWE